MIRGTVRSDGDAVINFRMRGPSGSTVEIEAVVDTGFSDWLTLGANQISALGLRCREEGRFTLADGTEVLSRIFTAEVERMGRWRRILAAELEGGALMGMSMLRGCHLGIEVVDGGQVEIRPLDE